MYNFAKSRTLLEEQAALESPWLERYETKQISGSSCSYLVNMPHLVMLHILEKVNPFSLVMISMTCSSMRTMVDTFLLTNKVVDMTEKDCRSMGWDKRRELFRFLTKNGSITNLRKLVMNDELSSLHLIRKVLTRNKKLENVVLVNIKLSSSSMSLIKNLPELKLLKISYEMCEDESDEMFIELKMLDQGCQCHRSMSKYHNYELEYGVSVLGKPRLCSLCFSKFSSFSRFVTHFRNIHSNPVKCRFCEEMFPVSKILQHKRGCQSQQRCI